MNMNSYKWMKDINSQVCEQRNNALRKIAKSVAHMTFDHYMKTLKLFFTYTNLKVKGTIAAPKLPNYM